MYEKQVLLMFLKNKRIGMLINHIKNKERNEVRETENKKKIKIKSLQTKND